jgi:hypothetical protein
MNNMKSKCELFVSGHKKEEEEKKKKGPLF